MSIFSSRICLAVSALKVIALKLNKTDWDFGVDPCNKKSRSWITPVNATEKIFANNVTCDCNNSTICHIISIKLKGQNLSGILPDEFSNLRFLRVLDLRRNYLNGSIPSSWASLPLEMLSLLGNRISGSIPKEFGRITTLNSLDIQDNSLGGPLPSELGNLINLEGFRASGNSFTGPLPKSYSKLRNLMDFRIDGSSVTGKISDFIGNWTKLYRLDIQGTSLEGPFPHAISQLVMMKELRISDLRGSNNTFPSLENMGCLTELVLRNCSISGEIPLFVADFYFLIALDLSFNNLTGVIPISLEKLGAYEYMYFTNNKLTGEIPPWILRSDKKVDISYNRFTKLPPPPGCGPGNMNYVSSYSTVDDSSIRYPCLRKNFPCMELARNYKLFINCGGEKITYRGRVYEEDSVDRGSSAFYSIDQKWAYSSTGNFLDAQNRPYVVKNTSAITSEDRIELYKTARTAPISLKYYGLCLQEGYYVVGLHFAEISFTNDLTYASVGKRIFDVAIQGKLVLRNFNIEEEAGGAGKGIVRNFTALIRAPSHSLEIHLYWTGKGTTSIPTRGTYGPIISAISVTPNFKPDLGVDGLSLGAILGVVASSYTLVVFVGILTLRVYSKADLVDKELQGLEMTAGYFGFRQIKAATRHFHPSNKIGEGGFGPVYKGTLPDGSKIAVKLLSSCSNQGNREFLNEVAMISALQHPNLVKLFGCCIEGDQLLLIYEFMENNNLGRSLFGRKEGCPKLDWPTRFRISIGIAKGLTYLHEESRLKIVHRDIKAANILLDRDFNVKISDFGLARLHEEDETHVSTRIAGTIGYMAPEYAMRGYLTSKADVYSYGILLLEIVSGKSNTSHITEEELDYILDWAYVLHDRGCILELVDPNLGNEYVEEEALRLIHLALSCTNPSFTLRPLMSDVVKMLQGEIPVEAPVIRSKTSMIGGDLWETFDKFSHAGPSNYYDNDSDEGTSEIVELPYTF